MARWKRDWMSIGYFGVRFGRKASTGRAPSLAKAGSGPRPAASRGTCLGPIKSIYAQKRVYSLNSGGVMKRLAILLPLVLAMPAWAAEPDNLVLPPGFHASV